MVRDGDAADRDNDFRHRNRHPDAGNVPQDYDGDDVDPDNGPEDVLPCYSYQPNGTADMNLNPTLVKNIRQHDHFKGLSDFRTFTSVIDEIYERCTSVLFWMSGTRRQVSQGLQDRGVSAGGVPSTTVILLYKLYTLRLTRKQIKTMLNHPDTPCEPAPSTHTRRVATRARADAPPMPPTWQISARSPCCTCGTCATPRSSGGGCRRAPSLRPGHSCVAPARA